MQGDDFVPKDKFQVWLKWKMNERQRESSLESNLDFNVSCVYERCLTQMSCVLKFILCLSPLTTYEEIGFGILTWFILYPLAWDNLFQIGRGMGSKLL